MEWYVTLVLIFGALVLLMMMGMPVAFCFMLISLVGAYILFGGVTGIDQMTMSFFTTLASFILLPLALFVLMGELMFLSGIGFKLIDAVEKWLGRIPGRLSLVAVGAGTLFATLTGASIASVAMLGEVLMPEMEKRGYKSSMSLGPILGSGGLAIMIPPSSLAIVLGAIGETSISKILIAIIMPGLLIACLYASYIILRSILQKGVAPAYDVNIAPWSEKLKDLVYYILPMGFVIFSVTGVMLAGIATPSEAAATGCAAIMILIVIYRGLKWQAIKRAINNTVRITGMIFMILAASKIFSSILAFTGATKNMSELAISLAIPPVAIIIGMMAAVLILGCFMSPVPIMMICLPIFMPVVKSLGFNDVWFSVLFLLNIEMSTTTPPFGMSLFVMKGITPPHITMGDIVRAALPFLYLDALALALIIIFPPIALWLPNLMR